MNTNVSLYRVVLCKVMDVMTFFPARNDVNIHMYFWARVFVEFFADIISGLWLVDRVSLRHLPPVFAQVNCNLPPPSLQTLRTRNTDGAAGSLDLVHLIMLPVDWPSEIDFNNWSDSQLIISLFVRCRDDVGLDYQDQLGFRSTWEGLVFPKELIVQCNDFRIWQIICTLIGG